MSPPPIIVSDFLEVTGQLVIDHIFYPVEKIIQYVVIEAQSSDYIPATAPSP
jgi:hypothetical protein